MIYKSDIVPYEIFPIDLPDSCLKRYTTIDENRQILMSFTK